MVKESVNSLVVKKLEVPQEEANQIQNGEGKIVEVNGQKIEYIKMMKEKYTSKSSM